jgi:kumamolisin
MTTPIEPHAIGPIDPDLPMTVTVSVRPRHPAPSDAEIESRALSPIAGRKYPTREAFADAQGAEPSDLETVAAFARRHGLDVAESDAARRRVILTGSAADFSRAFNVTLHRFQGPSGEFRGTSDEIRVPPDLHPAVEAILGLDDRPAARRHDRKP